MNTFLPFEIPKKVWVAIGGGAVLLALFAVQLSRAPSAEDYALAERALSRWEEKPEDDLLYKEMRGAMKKAPALLKKKEGVIGQKLLDLGKREEALLWLQGPLKRLEKGAPEHAHYAAISLSIEAGEYQRALEESVALKEKLPRGELLFGENLVRIAFLQQALKNGPGERAAWEEVEAFLSEGSLPSQELLHSFREKRLTLLDYLQERKKGG